MNRRSFLVGSAAAIGAIGLAGCTSLEGMSRAEAERVYGPLPDERFAVPAVNLHKVDPKYLRRTGRYASTEAAGTIIIKPRARQRVVAGRRGSVRVDLGGG